MTKAKMGTIERVRIGGAVAANVRAAAEAPTRKIHVVGKDGKVKGFASEADVAKGALALHEIAFSTVEGVRPKRAICKACGKSFEVPADGNYEFYVPVVCPYHANQLVCAGFDGPCPLQSKPPKGAFRSFSVRSRNGKPWECWSCAGRRRQAKIPPDRRREITDYARSRRGTNPGDTMRSLNARMTQAERSERTRRANASRSPEKRSEAARKAWATKRAKAKNGGGR